MSNLTVDVCCWSCGKNHQLEVDAKAFFEWKQGKNIQDAFPEMSSSIRELLISGTCDPCFNKLFAEETVL